MNLRDYNMPPLEENQMIYILNCSAHQYFASAKTFENVPSIQVMQRELFCEQIYKSLLLIIMDFIIALANQISKKK